MQRYGVVELAPSPRLRGASTRCRVCNHPELDDIETSIRSGLSYAAVAKQFKLDLGPVRRHLLKHMDNLEMATAVASAAAMRLSAARRRAEGA